MATVTSKSVSPDHDTTGKPSESFSEAQQLVIERINRAGHRLDLHVFTNPRLSIGRAYNQAYILDDEYVDAQHMQLRFEAKTGELTCIDLGSCNGVKIEPKVGRTFVVAGACKLHSGDTVVIGRTRLRVSLGFQPVPPAHSLRRHDRLIHALSIWPIAALLIAAVIALSVIDMFIESPVSDQLWKHGLSASYIVLAAFIYAGIWALIGRLLKGEGRFTTQLILGLSSLIAVSIGYRALSWLAYHWPFPQFWQVAYPVAAAVGLFFLVYASSSMAMRLPAVGRLVLASFMPVIIAIGVLLNHVDRPENVNRVNYHKELVRPVLNYRSTVSSEDFVKKQRGSFPQQD